MKVLSLNRSIVSLFLLSASNHIYAMESDGYKVIETIHIPRAVTLATNSDCIAVGTVVGPVKLFDHKGKDKGRIPYCGDGGLLSDDNKIIQAGRKGHVYKHSGNSYTVKLLGSFDALIYSIAQHKDQLFFGSNNNMVHAWDIDDKYTQSYTRSYTGTSKGNINALQATDKAIITGSSNGSVTSLDRETGSITWNYQPGHIPLMDIVEDGSLSYAGYRGGDLLACDEHYYYDRIPLKKFLYSLAFLKSGYLLVGHTGSIGIYDMRKIVKPLIELILEKKDSSVIELETTEDGFVTLVDDGTVQIWEEVEQK